MKTIILIILIFLKTDLFALQNDSLKNYNINIELSLIYPIIGGFGGTIGIEKNHFSFGVMGFGIKLNDMMKHYLMENVEGLKVFNWGVELYSDFYFKQSHRGLFLGGLLSLNGFRFTDIPVPETILVLYAIPRIGYRIYLPKKLSAFYFQPAITVQFKVWDNAEKFLYQQIDMKSGFLLSQLTMGMKI